MIEEDGHLVVSAPGKVILHGEHAVVHGKRALACSLDLRTYLHVTRSLDGMVRISLPDINIYREWQVQDLKLNFFINNNYKAENLKNCSLPSDEEFQSLCRYCQIDPDTTNTIELAVIAFLYILLTILGSDKLEGLDFMVSSNLPTSAGLGSSAAFAVTLVSSLLKLSGRIGDPGAKSFNAWTDEDLDTINQWAFVAEKIIHGNPSGVDNSVSTYGGLLKYQNKQLHRLDCKHTLSVVITNTKVPRSTKKMVAGVGNRLKQYPDIINSVMDAMEAVSTRCQAEITSDEPMNEQVVKEMISMNQSLLSVLGVSHLALEKVCSITHQHGLVSKLTGAGGGGCTFTFLPSDVSEEQVETVIGEVKQQGFDCWKTVIGGPGVGLHFGEPNSDFTIPLALQSRAKMCNILWTMPSAELIYCQFKQLRSEDNYHLQDGSHQTVEGRLKQSRSLVMQPINVLSIGSKTGNKIITLCKITSNGHTSKSFNAAVCICVFRGFSDRMVEAPHRLLNYSRELILVACYTLDVQVEGTTSSILAHCTIAFYYVVERVCAI
ncbi:mevalonate kinase-like [Watersipora subatra]|uniref:mevalonate kinase-like n=1 Tax=Watersipora subatra TaxID=2589382 RepID=UPI00355C96C5